MFREHRPRVMWRRPAISPVCIGKFSSRCLAGGLQPLLAIGRISTFILLTKADDLHLHFRAQDHNNTVAMKMRVIISGQLVGAWCALAMCLRTEAAIQVNGTATYEVFSRGARRLLVEEEFSGQVEGKKWCVSTRLLSTQPPLTRPELFCPDRQSVGSEGADVYYLKEMGSAGTQTRLGWVEPGPAPNLAQSPTACLFWMAYCSGTHLPETESQASNDRRELQPVWGTDENKNRRGECMVRVTWHRSQQSPDFLDDLNFLSDGRMNPCNASRDITNLWPKPWSGGFTQGLFQVEEAAMLPTGGRIPAAFSFQLLKPVYGANPPKLDALSAMRGVITGSTSGVHVSSWLPQLPKDQPLAVQDYRFTREVTNWSAVSYVITNEWSTRKGTAAMNAAVVHARISPPAMAITPKSKGVTLARGLLLAVVALPLIGLLIRKLTSNRKH